MYLPSDDSYFFREFLEKKLSPEGRSKSIKILDMGTGSGILARTCSKFTNKKNILCVDIQRDSVVKMASEGFNSIQSNLFSKIPRSYKFDVILFNAPYLPRDLKEDRGSQIETTGGTRGDEISIRFIKQSKNYLAPRGKIYLLVSSLTPLTKLAKFNPKIVARKKIWFEELLILEFTFEGDKPLNCSKKSPKTHH